MVVYRGFQAMMVETRTFH